MEPISVSLGSAAPDGSHTSVLHPSLMSLQSVLVADTMNHRIRRIGTENPPLLHDVVGAWHGKCCSAFLACWLRLLCAASGVGARRGMLGDGQDGMQHVGRTRDSEGCALIVPLLY